MLSPELCLRLVGCRQGCARFRGINDGVAVSGSSSWQHLTTRTVIHSTKCNFWTVIWFRTSSELERELPSAWFVTEIYFCVDHLQSDERITLNSVNRKQQGKKKKKIVCLILGKPRLEMYLSVWWLKLHTKLFVVLTHLDLLSDRKVREQGK